MNGWRAAWQTTRVVRWALWVSAIAYGVYFISDRAPHMNHFGQLRPFTEMFMFGLPGSAVVAGFLELMFRAWATGKPEV